MNLSVGLYMDERKEGTRYFNKVSITQIVHIMCVCISDVHILCAYHVNIPQLLDQNTNNNLRFIHEYSKC